MATEPVLDYRTYSTIVEQAQALVRKVGKGLTRADGLLALMRTYPDDPRYAAAARRYGRQTAPARAVVTKVVPVRKAEALATPVYDEIRLQGDALFRTGQVGSTWEGMGQYASSHPDVYQAYVEECRRVNGQPDARLTKAMAALAPPRSATDTLMQAITTRQAAEGLSFVAASDVVRKEAPALYDAYLGESRYPHLRGQPMPTQADDPAPTYEAILAMADAQVAKTAGVSRRAGLIALVHEHPGEQAYYEAYRKYHLSDGLAEHRAAVRAQGRAGQ